MKKVQLFALVALLVAGVMSSCRPSDPNDPNRDPNNPQPAYTYDENTFPGVVERDLQNLFSELMHMPEKKANALITKNGFTLNEYPTVLHPSNPEQILRYYEREVVEGYHEGFVIELTQDGIVSAVVADYTRPFEGYNEESYAKASRLVADFGAAQVGIYIFSGSIFTNGVDRNYYEGPYIETVRGAEDFANDLLTARPASVLLFEGSYADKTSTMVPIPDTVLSVRVYGLVHPHDGARLMVTYFDAAKTKETWDK